MVSIIICSVNELLLKNIKQNISKTIGCEFEILYYENKEEQLGICKVYNMLAKKAKGNFLCFCHEDVEFLTNNWGQILSEYANKDNVGVLGFAGAGSFFGFAYWNDKILYPGHCLQGSKDKKEVFPHPGMAFSGDYAKALVLDGLCLFCKRKIWEENHFDEKLFTGFHMYDMDFSLMCSEKYDNYVSYTVDIIHYSQGTMNNSFFTELEKFNKKWRNSLPKSITPFSKEQWYFQMKNGIKNTIKDLSTCTNLSTIRVLFYMLKSLQVRSILFIYLVVKYSIKLPKRERERCNICT